MNYDACPDFVKAAIPGLLGIPGRRAGDVSTAARLAWDKLDDKAKLGYLTVLMQQQLRDLQQLNDTMLKALL